jgi:hypothetical protein
MNRSGHPILPLQKLGMFVLDKKKPKKHKTVALEYLMNCHEEEGITPKEES